jgi:RHS repeat-associated protein
MASNSLPFSLPAPYSFSVSYAPNGDVLTANDSVNGNWTYSYDDFNRLAAANNSSPQQGLGYAYDRYGNRWQQNVTAGTANSSILTFSVTSGSVNGGSNGNCYHAEGLNNQPDGFCYDAAGNLLNDGQHTYTYDAEDRIIAVDGGQTASYVYDGAGQRIRKISAAGTADYLYDLAGHVVTELSGSGAWTRSEFFAGGRHLGTYNNGTTYFIQADWLGTERVRALPTGDTYESCVSLPFGDGLSCSGATDPSPNHLTGKARDSETGMDYFGARYYGSPIARFTSPDPRNEAAQAIEPQSWNAYSYVANNPLRNVDPDGRDYWVSLFGGDWQRYSDRQFENLLRVRTDYEYTPSGDIYYRPEYVGGQTGVKIGHASWFDGDAARRTQNSIDVVNWFMVNQTMEMAGGVGGVVVGRIGGALLQKLGPQIARNALKGNVGERMVEAMLRLKGYQIIGRHVTAHTSEGIRYIDYVVERAGEYTAVEVKTGGAVRSARQVVKDTAMEATGARLTNRAGQLAGKTLKLKTEVWRPF